MKYIAFDLGNVLLDVENMSDVFEAKEVNLININERLDFTGLIDIRDIFSSNLDRFQFGSRFELVDIINYWNSLIKPNSIMVEFIKKLKEMNISIAYLSNIGRCHLEYLTANYSEFMDLADVKFMSCNVGAAKPSLIYFQSFLTKYNKYRWCYYFDDRKENVDMANNCGLNAELFNLEELIKSNQLENRLEKIIYNIKTSNYLP